MLSVVLVVLLASAQAQAPPPATATGAPVGAFFALSVADVNAVSRWYAEKLGFEVLSSGEAPNGIAKFAILRGDGSLIEIIQHREASPRPKPADAFKTHGVFKAGFVVADLDRTYRTLKTRGVTIAYDMMPAKDVPFRSFIISDPEGNFIQFFGR